MWFVYCGILKSSSLCFIKSEHTLCSCFCLCAIAKENLLRNLRKWKMHLTYGSIFMFHQWIFVFVSKISIKKIGERVFMTVCLYLVLINIYITYWYLLVYFIANMLPNWSLCISETEQSYCGTKSPLQEPAATVSGWASATPGSWNTKSSATSQYFTPLWILLWSGK